MNCSSAYSNAKKYKWIEDICKHMVELKKQDGYWTYEKCKDVSLNCETKMEIYKKYRGAYNTINKYKWFELLEHIVDLRKSKKSIF